MSENLEPELGPHDDMIVAFSIEAYQSHKDYTGGSSFGGCKIKNVADKVADTLSRYPSAVIRIEPSKALIAQLRADDLESDMQAASERFAAEGRRVAEMLAEAATAKPLRSIEEAEASDD